MREIRFASDITEEHVQEAADMRSGLYGGEVLSWDDVIDRLESSDEDWGNSMDSEAIKALKRRVRVLLATT